MIRQLRLLILAGATLAALHAPARAAFEDVAVSPRLRALGGAGIAVLGDAYAPLQNPSALAWADGIRGAASYVRPFTLDYAVQNAVGLTLPLPGRAGGAGLGVRTFGVDYQGESLQRETTVSLAHAFHLLRDFHSELAVGWSLSLHTLSFGSSVTGLDPGEASTLGLGVGATAVVRERTRVGFAVHNLNNPSIGDRDETSLPRRVAGGVAYTPYAGVVTLLDMRAELGAAVEYRGGFEIEATDFMWLRAGVCTEPNAFTAGVGVRAGLVRLDYGFSSGGVLDDTHQVGIELVGRAPWSAER